MIKIGSSWLVNSQNSSSTVVLIMEAPFVQIQNANSLKDLFCSRRTKEELGVNNKNFCGRTLNVVLLGYKSASCLEKMSMLLETKAKKKVGV